MEIDVEKIMQEIRSELMKREGWEDLPSFDSVPIRTAKSVEPTSANPTIANEPASTDSAQDEYAQEVNAMNCTWKLVYWWPLSSNPIKRFLQRVIKKLLKFLFIPVMEEQNEFNSHTVRSMNWTKGHIDGLTRQQEDYKHRAIALEKKAASLEEKAASLEERSLSLEQTTGAIYDQMTALVLNSTAQEDRIINLEQNMKTIEEQASSLEQSRAELKNRATTLEERASNFERITIELSARLEQTTEELSNKTGVLEQEQKVLRQKTNDLEIQNDDLLAALAKSKSAQKSTERIQNLGISQSELPSLKEGQEEENTYTVLDYFKFENHFRGSRSEIRERQSVYLPYFKDQNGPILDFGCGRGEFLQLMKKNNIPAFGVDLYPEYAAEGELLGVDIRQGDGFAFLRDTKEQFGGIYVGQVIEHISFLQLQELCALAYEKLLPGAYLILETQNPMCLSIFSNAFYIDPTHNKPVHPFTVKYLLEELQFQDVDLLFTECSRLEPLPLIQSSEIANLEEVNAGISRVSELLYGSRDYAVVARK